MISFTDSQKLACDISRNIAVTAGAGSGKTSVLVERYLWCLQNNGYQVRRVVAITFTEKAAGEMLSRIRQQVIDYATRGIGDTNRWEDVLESLALANISTIHGFCQRLLREFPIEAGVDPNFEIFDEAAKRICLTHLIQDVIYQRDTEYDENMAILADLWSSPALQSVLLHLIEFRSSSLPWAQRVIHKRFPEYLLWLRDLVQRIEREGIRQLAEDPRWQEAITKIRALIPEEDTSKLTHRCRNILDYDGQFRTQTDLNEQLITLKMLRKDCRMVTPSQKWKEEGRNIALKDAFDQLKRLYDTSLPGFEVNEALEQSGFAVQQALAELFLQVYDLYRQEKTARHVLDFDDLQERTLVLLDDPHIHALLSRRYDYIMVDEFQDTNQLQWNIIRKLGMVDGRIVQDKFCIVGDEKQSIYMFRGAEVAVFGEVRQKLRRANLEHDVLSAPPKIPELGERPEIQESQRTGELIMAENFRSVPELIFFFNALFSRLFIASFDPNRPYDVQHQELLAGRKNSHSGEGWGEGEPPVEFLFVTPDEEASGQQTSLEEPELVALKICELAQKLKYRDIAILLRARTRLKDFEDALRHHDIPFVVAGGIGFFQQQEIYDLANLLRALVDHRQDIALTGVLRSPLFSFSDDQLLYVASFDQETLWQKLAHCAQLVEAKGEGRRAKGERQKAEERREEEQKSRRAEEQEGEGQESGSESISEELDPPKFLHAYTLLRSWKSQADRIPITHLLRHILEDTGLYGILSGSRREIQSFINLEKLLDIARTFEGMGFQSLSDFVAYLDLLIEIEERESEAQINFEGIDAVRLMTIHAAKGLEFPVVLVPEFDRPFNYGASESVYLDRLRSDKGKVSVVGIKGLDPEQNYASEDTLIRQYLRRVNIEKTDAEMKRLLYVACTRAEDHLVLSGTLPEKLSRNSWLAWIMDIFPLEEAISQGAFTISEDGENRQECMKLAIPVSTSKEYQGIHSPILSQGADRYGFLPCSGQSPLLGGAGVGKRDSKQIQRSEPTPNPSQEGNKAPSPLVGEGWGEEDEVSRMLRQNLSPIRGKDNEIFTISPSTVHTLFQCPRKYYYQYILRLPEPSPSTPNSQLSIHDSQFDSHHEQRDYGVYRGTIIHKIFEEQLFDRDVSEQELFATVQGLLDDMLVSEEDRQTMRLDDMIRKTYQTYQSSGIRELLAGAPQVYREYPFELRSGRIDVSGTIDVLFFDLRREMWTILDYKSNEIEAQQIAEEIQRHGYDIQMQLYALAVSKLLHVERVRSILFFTFPGSVYDAVDILPNTLEALKASIETLLKQISEGKFDISQKQIACEECEYMGYNACVF